MMQALFSSIKSRMDSKDYLSFSVLIANELLAMENRKCNETAVEVFRRLKKEGKGVTCSILINLIDEEYQQKFYHFVLGMEHCGLVKEEETVIDGWIHRLGIIPISNLNPFIGLLFSKPYP